MYAKLKNGFEIVAVNAGYAFSFVKPYIKKLHFMNVKNEGSQFRSRDYYPKAVSQIIKKNKKIIGTKEDLASIPNVPKNTIASIDGYGNIKTTTRLSDVNYAPGQEITIEINRQKHLATYTNGVFNITGGQLAFAPGSSGHNDKFMEIFVRGGNAYKLFDSPKVEEEFIILKK